MVSVSICPECKGKGFYFVYNAYNPDSKEQTFCECCGGEGTLEDTPLYAKSLKKNRNDWIN